MVKNDEKKSVKRDIDTKKNDKITSKGEKKVKEVKSLTSDINLDLSEIKNDLTEFLMVKVEKEVSKEVEKSTKKLIRHKNSIILRKNVIIIFLLIVCAFLAYNLYTISDINIDIDTHKKTEKKVLKTEKKSSAKKENKKDDDFEVKKEEYKDLLDDIYVNDESEYVKDFYSGKLSDELKLYLALNHIDSEKLSSEDGSIYLEENDLKESYESFLVGSFSPKSFEYNNLKFRHLSSKKLFISDGEFDKKKENIDREIIEVDVDDDKVKIITVEGIIKDEKLYNVVTGEEVKKYKKDGLKKYKKDLSVITYCFEKSDDKYKLSDIEV